MKQLVNKVKNLFKMAKLLSTIDSGSIRQASVSMLGKSQTVMILSPYGLMHNPPPGSLVALWSQQGQESGGIGMADDPANRTLKNLKPGEVAIGNYLTGSYILFKEDGSCLIVANAVEVTSSELTHNSTNVGDTHVHSQPNDSANDTEADTEGPK